MLNAKMYVVGAKHPVFFQRSKVVKKLAKIGRSIFVIVISSYVHQVPAVHGVRHAAGDARGGQ